MSFYETLLGIFTDEDEHQQFEDNPEGYLNEHGYGDVTAAAVNQEMPRVLEALQGGSQFNSQGGFADFSGSGNVHIGGEGGIPPYEGDAGGLTGAIESLHHYTQVLNITNQSFSDDDVNVFNDNDNIVDNSFNQQVTSFGEFSQDLDFDNDTAIGDGSVADGGEGSTINTGDGAVQNTGTIADSTIATGDVGGSVTGDNYDSVVGDGNQVIDDSTVGAAAFGGGDATNIQGENLNFGDGTIVDDVSGGANVNTGSGDLTDVDGSTLVESSVGSDGDFSSDDTYVSASDGSNIAFGEGSSVDDQDVSVAGNDGVVQVAGDGSTQSAVNDESVNDSFNYDDSDTYTLEYTDNSVDASVTDNSVDASDDDGVDVDDSFNTQDNDGIDVDAQVDVGTDTPDVPIS